MDSLSLVCRRIIEIDWSNSSTITLAQNNDTTMILTEEDIKNLQEKILQQKMSELFEEPSSYEDEIEED